MRYYYFFPLFEMPRGSMHLYLAVADQRRQHTSGLYQLLSLERGHEGEESVGKAAGRPGVYHIYGAV